VMRGALNCAAKDLSRRARDPFGLLMWLGIPLAIGLMLKLAFGGDNAGPRALLLLETHGSPGLVDAALAALGTTDGLPLDVERVEDAAAAQQRIEAGEASAYLALPEGFLQSLLAAEPLELELLTNPAQRIRPGLAEETLRALFESVDYLQRLVPGALDDLAAEFEDAEESGEGPSGLAIAAAGSAIGEQFGNLEGLLFPPRITVVDTSAAEAEAAEESLVGIGELFFGSLLILSLAFMSSGLAEDLWFEKTAGTLRRSLSLPGGAFALIAGKLLCSAALLFAVSLSGVAVGKFLFDLELSNFFGSAVWATVIGLFLTSLLLLIQTFASTQRTGALLANLVVMPLMMFGGCFFPFDAMPEWMIAIGTKLPNGWGLLRLQNLLTGTPEPALLGAGALGFLVAILALAALTARRVAGRFGSAA
jgi:ABC-type multidrug transport system permease subunit